MPFNYLLVLLSACFVLILMYLTVILCLETFFSDCTREILRWIVSDVLDVQHIYSPRGTYVLLLLRVGHPCFNAISLYQHYPYVISLYSYVLNLPLLYDKNLKSVRAWD